MTSRRFPTRPSDQPVFTNPVDMDFEKRRLIVPSSFIKLAVLKGGDEYVKVEDLATIVNAFMAEMWKMRIQLEQMKLHLAKMSNENITDKDVGG